MAITFLETTRKPVFQLLVLNEDGSTLADITSHLMISDLQFTDELISHQATFTLSNEQAYFDKYGAPNNGAIPPVGPPSPGCLLVENRLIQFKKGFVDPATQLPVLYSAFVGRITMAKPSYNRTQGEKIVVTCFDLFKLSLKHKFTSDPYYNTQVNIILQDLVTRYGDKAVSALFGFNLASLNLALAKAQFPDMTLIDSVLDCIDVPVYGAWMNYAGQFETYPRLGTAASGSGAQLGYPDATAPPSVVDFTFPDAALIEQIDEQWQDFDFINQVKVLGIGLSEAVTLGPDQAIVDFGDPVNFNFLAPRGGVTKRLFYSQQTGAQNQLSAQGVYLKIWDPSFSNNTGGTPYKYIASGPGIQNDIGQIIPYPVNEQIFPPGEQNVVSQKSDGRIEGGIALKAVTPTFVDVFAFANSDGGGFEWAVEVRGRPVLTQQQTLTAIVDYNAQNLTETLTDVFGDHQTYQGSKAPWAGSVPIELTVNPASMPSTTVAAPGAGAGASTLPVTSIAGLLPPANPSISAPNVIGIGSGATREYAIIQSAVGGLLTLSGPLSYNHAATEAVNGLTGVVSADDIYASLLFKADFERGRIVFTDLTYRPFSADMDYSSFGGASYASTNAIAFDTTHVVDPAPLAAYQSNRQVNWVNGSAGQGISYLLTGLTPGRGYLVRLHFADPTWYAAGQRIFAIYCQGAVIEPSFDIYQQAQGTYKAVVKEISGVVPDISGNISLAVQNGGADGGFGNPLICGVEIIAPQGTGGTAYAINSGGAAITPAAPVVQAAYGWSSVQQTYGLQSTEINDPLLSTLAQCQARGQYEVNKSAWQRNPVKLIVPSVPTIKPGRNIKWFNPRIGANGTDFWGYVQAIQRRSERTEQDGIDQDMYSLYILDKQAR